MNKRRVSTINGSISPEKLKMLSSIMPIVSEDDNGASSNYSNVTASTAHHSRRRRSSVISLGSVKSNIGSFRRIPSISENEDIRPTAPTSTTSKNSNGNGRARRRRSSVVINLSGASIQGFSKIGSFKSLKSKLHQ